MRYWSLVVALLVVLAPVSLGVSLETICIGHPTGTLLPNPRDCNSYYVCQSDASLAFCDHGLHFDRVSKVCNWPAWANCKLESIEEEGEKEQSELVDPPNNKDTTDESKRPTKKEQPSIKPGSSDSEESARKPEAKEPSKTKKKPTFEVKVPMSPEINGALLNSSPSKPSAARPGKKPSSTQETTVDQKVSPGDSIPDRRNATELSSDSTHSLKVEVAVPSRVPAKKNESAKPLVALQKEQSYSKPTRRPSKTGSTDKSKKMLSQVPVLQPTESNIVAELESEGGIDQISHASGDLVKSPTHNLTENQIAVNISIPSVQTSPKEVPVSKPNKKLNQATNGTEGDAKGTNLASAGLLSKPTNIQGPLGSLIQIESSSKAPGQVIDLPVPVEKPSSSEEAHGSIPPALPPQQVVEKLDSGSSSKTPGQVIDLPASIEEPVASAENHELNPELSQLEQIIEKLASESSSKPPGQVIDLDVPGGEQPSFVEPHELTSDLLLSQQAVEKLNVTSSFQAPGQVIDLSPSEGVSDLISGENPSESIAPSNEESAQPAALVEKIESPESNPSQVIELQASEEQHTPRESHEDHDTSIELQQATVEKIEASSQDQGANKVIDLSESGTFIADQSIEETVSIDHDEDAIAVVEKVETQKPNPGSNQVIELLDPELPSPIMNTLIENASHEVEKPSPSAPNRPPIVIVSSIPNMIIEQLPPPIYTIGGKPSTEDEDSSQSNESDAIPNSDDSDEEGTASLVQESSEEVVDLDGSVDSQQSDESSGSRELASGYVEESEESVEKADVSEESEELTSPPSSEESSLKPFKPFDNDGHIKTPTVHEVEVIDHVIHPTDELSVKPLQPNPQNRVDEVSMELQHNSESHENDLQSVATPELVSPIPKEDPPSEDLEAKPTNHSSNLIITILSVERYKGNNTNATIVPPVVGAHDILTGHPIDPLNGYNIKNVQCIHSGLYFLPHPADCQKYFICAYHHLHLHSCGNGLIWSYKREQCEIETSASRCFLKDSPKLPDPETRKPSSPPEDHQAVSASTVATRKPITPTPPIRSTQPKADTFTPDNRPPMCPGLQQVYLPSFDDCSNYYICILGHAVLTSCPEGFNWDATRELCGKPEHIRCARR